jgi:hypothetical protein
VDGFQHLAKVRLAGLIPVVGSNELVGQGPLAIPRCGLRTAEVPHLRGGQSNRQGDARRHR